MINNIKVLYYKLYNYWYPTGNKFTDFGVIPWWKILLGIRAKEETKCNSKNTLPLDNQDRYKATDFWGKLNGKKG